MIGIIISENDYNFGPPLNEKASAASVANGFHRDPTSLVCYNTDYTSIHCFGVLTAII